MAMAMIGSSIDRPTTSETAAFQSPKKADVAAVASHHALSYIPVCSSDEEDDSRDRQSHWKRIKTRSDDITSNGRSRIKWTEPQYDASPVRKPLQALVRRVPSPKKGLNPHNPSGHRLIVTKSRLHDGGHGLDVAKDGGTASSRHLIMDAGVAAGKRKFEPDHRMISMNIDMYERVREPHQQMARRLPGTAGRYEVRVREEGEFYDEDDDDDSSLFLGDSNPRPKITVDLREALNRRTRGVVAHRETKGSGDGDGASERGFDVKVRVRRVDFDLSCASEKSEGRKQILPPAPAPSDAGKSLRIGAAVGSGKGTESDTEAERRRERWAEKERDSERDLQKELQIQALQKQHQKQPQPQPQQQQQQQNQNMATKAQQPKSVTVVDYSHKFTVAKAPLGVPAKPVEADPHRLCQRQKQIDYGKNTLGYERYTETVPRYQRTKAHPRTPDIRQVCSKRSWDGQIRKWRRLLHEYDPPKEEDDEDPDQMFIPGRDPDGTRGSVADDACMMDMQSELVEDADLKIYDGWSDEEC